MKRIEVKEFKKLALRLEVKDNSFAGTSIGSMTNVYNFCNFSKFSNSQFAAYGDVSNFYNFCRSSSARFYKA